MSSFTYKWQKANPDGSSVADIAGATGSFVVSPPATISEALTADSSLVGKVIRLVVTDGVSTWEGAWSATITAAPVTGSSHIYWGAYMEGPNTYGTGFSNAPWDTNTWNRFETNANKTVSICHFGQPNFQFNLTPHANCWNRGAIPFVDFSGTHSLVDIANGVYDSQIDAWATAYLNYGKPCFIRWGWEMNQYGSHWFNWAVPYYWSAAQYIAAWDRIKHRCDLIGATNMTWVWCPNFIGTDSSRVSGITSVYPNEEPDWLAFDGYNSYAPSQHFDSLYGLTYSTLTGIDNTKPIMIGEFGSRDTTIYNAGVKADWITEALTTKLAGGAYPNIKAAVWFNWRIYENGVWKDWQIESSTGPGGAQAAFATAIADPYFKSKFTSVPAFGKVPIPT